MIDEFSNAIYYPAGGTDLQVFLRYSDLSDTVISPTLSDYLDLDTYNRLFRQKCGNINAYFGRDILLYEGFEVMDSEWLERNRRVAEIPNVFEEGEREDYEKAFGKYFRKPIKIIRFTFTRVVGPHRRKLQWIASNTEGLATLVILHRLTRSSPKMFCTIQSGVMEWPDSVFVRLLQHLNLPTKIWVRGFWREYWWPGLPYDDRPISNFLPYPNVIQDYGYWYSPMGVRPERNEDNHHLSGLSIAKAFTNLEDLPIPAQMQIQNTQGRGRTVRLIQADISPLLANPQGVDLIITSSRIFSQPHDRIITWESLAHRPVGRLYPPILFSEALELIMEVAQKRDVKKIAITPMGYEDETLLLRDFVEKDGPDLEVTIYHKQPLDYIALKAPDFL